MKPADRAFLRQMHWAVIIDKLFTYVTPAFCIAVVIAAIASIIFKGGPK